MSTHNTSVIGAALEVINQQNQQQAQGKAILLINDIIQLKDCIASQEQELERLKQEHQLLTMPSVTDIKVLGIKLPPEAVQNENEKTIAAVLDTLNKGKQGHVKSKSTLLAEAVLAKQASIEAANLTIDKKREELSKLTVVVVTAETIQS